MLNELGNDTNLGFTTNDRNQTLEAVLGDSSMTEFQVLVCLTNSSKTQNEFTQILVDFTFTTQINSSTVAARGIYPIHMFIGFVHHDFNATITFFSFDIKNVIMK